MTTGRIDRSPDYKSANAIDAVTKTIVERARLRDAVIEAAKEWRSNFFVKAIYSDLLRGIDRPLAETIDALIQFESSQEQ